MPRDRMVRSAAQLIRRKGVSGTGMREIVIEADAPRGSLQHYFPGGKEELVSDALLWMGGVAARRVERSLRRDRTADSERSSGFHRRSLAHGPDNRGLLRRLPASCCRS